MAQRPHAMTAHRLSLNTTEFLARSRAITGIDIVDSDIEESLDRLIDALNGEAELNEAGARGMERRILTILANRLRMQRDFQIHPEIERQPIVRPHFLTGAGRSGSTKLHKLLAASGDFKFLRFWHQYNPSLLTGRRAEDPSERVRDAAQFIDWFNSRSPQARYIHEYNVFEPEEETFLFDHGRPIINVAITHASIPSYMQWWMTQDMHAQLEHLERMLKYLQWQFFEGDDRPWLLKNPIYCGLEPLLVQRFPDAVFVATHRDPVARVASSAGLTVHMQKAYSDVDRSRQAGPVMLEFMAAAADQYVAGREAFVRILDVGYTELTQRSIQVAQKIYDFAGRPLTDRARQSMERWEQENAQHKHGVYRYSLADYSLTPEMVIPKFTAYCARFRDYL
jgi:LPS sulfotransferase NodH